MHSMNAVRSAAQSTSVHMWHVHVPVQLSQSMSVCTVTAVIGPDESVSARSACISHTTVFLSFSSQAQINFHQYLKVERYTWLRSIGKAKTAYFYLAENVSKIS